MRERGAVSVEFAAAMPLVCVALLLVAQSGLLVSEQLVLQHAAREGARVAAITNDDERARAAVLEAGALEEQRVTIDIEPEARAVGDPVEVRLAYRPRVMPLVGRFVSPSATLRARASMRTERAPP